MAGIVGGADPESRRLEEDKQRRKNWKRWGPYLADRQWSTVREDYSSDGSAWSYFPHEHARSRAYRWGEDGLLGITDRQCRLCFSPALWNGEDRILKERLFGLTPEEANNGEDVKECYYFLESSPTHSYMKALYKYPQSAFPYEDLVETNRARNRGEPEYELIDTGVFSEGRYFDIFVEYAKGGPNDVGIRLTVHNRARERRPFWLLPTLWFRNSWSWGRSGEGYLSVKPKMGMVDPSTLYADHPELGRFFLAFDGSGGSAETLFTENETNFLTLYGHETLNPYSKDAFHEYVIGGKREAVNPVKTGTKACFLSKVEVPGEDSFTFRLRLFSQREAPETIFGASFDELFELRLRELEKYYDQIIPSGLDAEEKLVSRQAYAGLLWSKQFYYYAVREWHEGDPSHPPPSKGRNWRNQDWDHLYNRDVLSMPDKWEYPWYAAWDLAFHMVAMASVDPDFAKKQLVLLLREWYMHPNGQIPAYEFAFSDVNPPVHAWACWRVYKITAPQGKRDRAFLARTFHKLLLNFTWWVNRKDLGGNNLFSGGFLGLDNIGVFDRGAAAPFGGRLEQADATAWMAFYCATMLSIALELASEDPAYADVASKFFEHFVAISDAMNSFGESGLWDQLDGFYYDQLHLGATSTPLRVRSLVGIIPLFAAEVLDDVRLLRLPGFQKRMNWFLKHRPDLSEHVVTRKRPEDGAELRLLSLASKERLKRVLAHLFDEQEFLSPYGIRSLSKLHGAYPYVLEIGREQHRIEYVPGESNTGVFGGNSNWRGPIWLPLNYLLIEALERYHHFYGDTLTVEFPTGSGKETSLQVVADELSERLCRLFLPDAEGNRPCHGGETIYREDSNFRNLPLFYEYFHGDKGKGLGASHQTGWTALVARLLERHVMRGDRRGG